MSDDTTRHTFGTDFPADYANTFPVQRIPTTDDPTTREAGAEGVPHYTLPRDLQSMMPSAVWDAKTARQQAEFLIGFTTEMRPPRPDAASASVTEEVTSHILTGRVGRDECVDIAMDYINNNIVHEEGCEWYALDTVGDRHDCNCGVGAGLKELERIARLDPAARPGEYVTYVPQRLSRDCGIAALAMASGLSYDEVVQRLPASAVRECAEGDGLFSAQIPQLLGLLGCAVRSVFAASWQSDGLRGIRIYVSRSHYIVVRPDGKVNDPARGDGLDASAYDEAFDGWEVHRLPVAPRDAGREEIRVGREQDEIVAHGAIHVERMSDKHIWACLAGVSFDFTVVRGKIVWTPQLSSGWAGVEDALRAARRGGAA